MKQATITVENQGLRNRTMNIRVNDPKDVLFPSTYARWLLEKLVVRASERSGRVLDLGTGSGIVGIILFRLGCRDITVTDINTRALECARENIASNLAEDEWGDHIRFVESDLFENVGGAFDLIVANPPPLPDIKELRLGRGIDQALLAGPDGRAFLDRLLDRFDHYLNPRGRMVTTHASFCDLPKTEAVLEEKGFTPRFLLEDDAPLEFYPDVYSGRQQAAILRRLRELQDASEAHIYNPAHHSFKLYVLETQRGK